MSIRARLEQKARRRVSVRVQITDPGADARRAAEAFTLLLAAQQNPTRAEDVPALQEAYDAATAAVEEHFVDIWFTALPEDDFEKLWHRYGKGRDDVDQDGLMVALAAACADDEDLRDEAWWRDQLSRPEWTVGEKDDLYNKLFVQLHYSVPSGALPKG